MTVDEIRAVLFEAARLRVPRFAPDDTPSKRIQALEDHLLRTATMHARLQEARLHMQEALYQLDKEWQTLDVSAVCPPTSRRTAADVTAARRELRRDLWDGLYEAKYLVARLSEQITRLSHMGDDQIVSRIYSMMTGG